MTGLLLDFPWGLSDLSTPGHSALGCLLVFDNLVRSTGLSPVPFIEDDEYKEFWSLKTRPGHVTGRNMQRAVWQFLTHCRRQSDSTCMATPNPEPTRLRDSWKRALREEIDNEKKNQGWRSPQIIIPKSRRSDWPTGDEINIQCEKCGDQPASGPEVRVQVVLEEYPSHRFATSDLDPWDLQWIHIPSLGQLRQHPCCLPKPPALQMISHEALVDKLIEAREKGHRQEERYYFIPPDDWRPENVSKAEWREGRAFRREYSAERGKMGYRDYEGDLWVWDPNERHWDVQKGGTNYVKVSHTGKSL